MNHRRPRDIEPLSAALVLDVLRRLEGARSVRLAFVPDVIDKVAERTGLGGSSSKRAIGGMIYDLAVEGAVELQPESGINRLSKAELAVCPDGPEGTKLTWARVR